MDIKEEELKTCIQVLETMLHNKNSYNPTNKIIKRLFSNVAQLSRSRKCKKQKTKQSKTTQGKFPCYVCHEKYDQSHVHYKSMCFTCGDINFKKRMQSANLINKVAIVTGGRIKIGFQIALKLLRAGCVVVATTRFAADAYERYAATEDFHTWSERLTIVKANFESRTSVESFCAYIEQRFTHIDILVNNAAQTIWRPESFYEEAKQKDILIKSDMDCLHITNEKEHGLQIVREHDKHNQPLDLRTCNSWVATVETVPVNELLQVQIINCIVPFLLIQRFTPLLACLDHKSTSFIINVSAMEGVFDMQNKSPRHPHTNIAKAGLNMITRTSATDYIKRYNIAMNSVDTGFVTNEFPFGHRFSNCEPPLDEIDGAARVLDPIFTAVETGCMYVGSFLKDYQVSKW